MQAFYTVAIGRKPGIYMTWEECKLQVHHYAGCKHNKCKTKEEALSFLAAYGLYEQSDGTFSRSSESQAVVAVGAAASSNVLVPMVTDEPAPTIPSSTVAVSQLAIKTPAVPPSINFNGAPSSTSAASANISATKILGYEVLFPTGKTPFPSQKAVISKVLQALTRKEHALLESPTGTGKTLALLVSTLCWQKATFEAEMLEHNRKVQLASHPSGPNSSSEAISPTQSPLAITNENQVPLVDNDKNFKNPLPANEAHPVDPIASSIPNEGIDHQHQRAPKHHQIFYCSRTHSQLQQVVNELRNCHIDYIDNIKMCLLGSRSQLCVNDDVKALPKEKIDETCINMLKPHSGNKCSYATIRGIAAAGQKAQQLPIWDIEDMVQVGKKVHGCGYYGARSQLKDAQIVFAPYTYLLTPSIRSQLMISLDNTIVIFDEAHNIEDVACEASSVEVPEKMLFLAVRELRLMSENASASFRQLLQLLSRVYDWLQETIQMLQDHWAHASTTNKTAANDSPEVWLGEEAIILFNEKFGLNGDTLSVYKTHLQMVLAEQEDAVAIANMFQGNNSSTDSASPELAYEQDDNDDDDEGATGTTSPPVKTLSTSTMHVLKGLLAVFDLMLRDDAVDASDFRMVIKQPDGRPAAGNNGHMLCIWCLNAEIAFRCLDERCGSVLLTSGTLSPMDTFSGDLGMVFPIQVEANHVINMEKQIFVAVVSSAREVPFLCTYKHKDSEVMQQAMGESLRTISRLTPGGVLMFFPSYAMMDKVVQQWKESGLYDEIEGEVVATMQRGNHDPQATTNRRKSQSFGGRHRRYSHSSSNSKTMLKKLCPIFIEPRESKYMDEVLQDYYMAIDGLPGGKAIFLAVARGKVSEGIDFKDAYARAVLIVGIPFPNVSDLHVSLKKQYRNDKAAKSPFINNGSQWFSQQAFRAINQAVGRCIRHRNDFGAIFLFDCRFNSDEHIAQLSKWVRPAVQRYDRMEDAVLPMQNFFMGIASEFLTPAQYKDYFGPFSEPQQGDATEGDGDLLLEAAVVINADEKAAAHHDDSNDQNCDDFEDARTLKRSRKQRVSRKTFKKAMPFRDSLIGRAFSRSLKHNKLYPEPAIANGSEEEEDDNFLVVVSERQVETTPSHLAVQTNKPSSFQSARELSQRQTQQLRSQPDVYASLADRMDLIEDAVDRSPSFRMPAQTQTELSSPCVLGTGPNSMQQSPQALMMLEPLATQHTLTGNSPTNYRDASAHETISCCGTLADDDSSSLSSRHLAENSSDTPSCIELRLHLMLTLPSVVQSALSNLLGNIAHEPADSDASGSDPKPQWTLVDIPQELSTLSSSMFVATWMKLLTWMEYEFEASLHRSRCELLYEYLREGFPSICPTKQAVFIDNSTGQVTEPLDACIGQGLVKVLDSWDAKDGVVYREYLLCATPQSTRTLAVPSTLLIPFAVKIIAADNRRLGLLNHVWLHPAWAKLISGTDFH